MPSKKTYSGYRSYEYLSRGEDYADFKLAKEVGRVPRYVVPLSKSEEERLSSIIEKNILISLHDHTMVMPEDIAQVFQYIREGRIATGYEGLSASCLDAVFEEMTDGISILTSKAGWKLDDLVYELGMRYADIAHQDFIIRCERVADILEAHEDGKLAMVPSLECANCLENEVDRVDIVYGLGIRMMGLTYSETNMLGSGQDEKSDGGLTEFGHKVVKRMNKVGLAIDLSHSGRKTVLDAVEASGKPIFLTHFGSKAVSPDNVMNPKTDDVLQALAEKSGVAGLGVAGMGVPTPKHPESDIDSYMEHVEYCVKLIGVDHVAVGPDTLFGDHMGLYKIAGAKWPVVEGLDYNKVPYVKGLESPADFPNIPRWLVKHGYSDGEIAKIIGGNVLRVLGSVWR